MKKTTLFLIIGVSVTVMGLMAASWAQQATLQTYPVQKAPITPTRPNTVFPPTIATPVATAPARPQVTQPVAPTAQGIAPVQGAAATPAKAPVAPPTPEQAAEDQKQALQNLKRTAENDFHDKLSFPLTEEKMLIFVRTALRVEKVNQKWDVQIAGAQTDQMAIEYNNSAVEEMANITKSMQGMTLEQYNELTQLTAKDDKFNRVYLAYKEMIQQQEAANRAKPVAATQAPTSAAPATTTPAVAKPAAAAITPPSAPVNPGMPQAPAGSPAPPYSPPSAR